MTTLTIEQQVYRVVSRNGGHPIPKQPTEAQCRKLAHLLAVGMANGTVRFELSPTAWTGRSKWQMSKMIESLERQVEGRK